MRTLTVFAAAALALGLAAGPSQAADAWPGKPVRMVVPFPPGGATDAAAHLRPAPGRLSGPERGGREQGRRRRRDRRGVRGQVGSRRLHALLMGAVGSHAIHAAMPDKPGYDFGTAFVGVSMATSMPMALAVNSKVPARNVQELIALAKAKPGSITYGSAGPGTSQHMAGELFQWSPARG